MVIIWSKVHHSGAAQLFSDGWNPTWAILSELALRTSAAPTSSPIPKWAQETGTTQGSTGSLSEQPFHLSMATIKFYCHFCHSMLE